MGRKGISDLFQETEPAAEITCLASVVLFYRRLRREPFVHFTSMCAHVLCHTQVWPY